MSAVVAENQVLARFVQGSATYATTLLLLAVDRFGLDCLNWTGQVLCGTLEDELGCRLPRENRDKLQALATALSSDQFYRDPVVFAHVAAALNNDVVDFDMMPDIDPDQAAWAITEVVLSEGPDHPEFEPAVRDYLGQVLVSHGVHFPPDVLRIANYPEGFEQQVTDSIGDDPGAYSGYYRRGKEGSSEIVALLRERLGHLIAQVDHLPLIHRDAERWRSFMTRYAPTR
jgi:hypothetical protein